MKLHAFLSSTLEGGECLSSRYHRAFPPTSKQEKKQAGLTPESCLTIRTRIDFSFIWNRIKFSRLCSHSVHTTHIEICWLWRWSETDYKIVNRGHSYEDTPLLFISASLTNWSIYFWYLFIYGLFKNTLSIWDYRESKVEWLVDNSLMRYWKVRPWINPKCCAVIDVL